MQVLLFFVLPLARKLVPLVVTPELVAELVSGLFDFLHLAVKQIPGVLDDQALALLESRTNKGQLAAMLHARIIKLVNGG